MTTDTSDNNTTAEPKEEVKLTDVEKFTVLAWMTENRDEQEKLHLKTVAENASAHLGKTVSRSVITVMWKHLKWRALRKPKAKPPESAAQGELEMQPWYKSMMAYVAGEVTPLREEIDRLKKEVQALKPNKLGGS